MSGKPVARVGDKLVVPACDVGEVTAIETLTVEGYRGEFYRIRLPEGALTWVPMGRLLEKRIRKVMSRAKALEALEIMAPRRHRRSVRTGTAASAATGRRCSTTRRAASRSSSESSLRCAGPRAG